MSLNILVDDWYGLHGGFPLELKPGFTALVGPNGAGKTTLLQYLEEYADRHDIKVWRYSNVTDGGSSARATYQFNHDMMSLARSMTFSEGENVAADFGKRAKELGQAVRQAREEQYPLLILLDAIDSGASIDRARDLRHLFDLIEQDVQAGAEAYIVMAVNHYELAKAPADCVHVRTGEHLSFNSYDEYAQFICEYFDLDGTAVKPKRKMKH